MKPLLRKITITTTLWKICLVPRVVGFVLLFMFLHLKGGGFRHH